MVKSALRVAGVLGLCAFGLNLVPEPAAAQTDWTSAQRTPGFDDSGYGPYLIADQNQTIHAFNSQFVDRTMSIVYSSWTLEGSWTPPIVIIDAYRGDARLAGAFLDDAGYVHLAFFGGDDVAADFYYSRAHLSQAGRAPAWSTPRAIGPDAITPTAGALVGNGSGHLTLIYSGNIDNLLGNGVYAVHSLDSGETWSDPQLVYLTETRTFWPTVPEAVTDAQGRVHLVWSVASVSGNGEAVMYASLGPSVEDAPEPVTLAQAIDFEADTPSIAVHEGELKVIYHNGRPTTRWLITTPDMGESWTEPVRLTNSHIGSNGAASMVVDSGGNLHVVFGGRTGPHPATHGLWRVVTSGNSFSTPEPIVSGLQFIDRSGGEGFDPSFAQAVISQGNLLMVTWRTDRGAGRNGIWYSYKFLDVPRLPVELVPSPAPTPVSTEVPVLVDVNSEQMSEPEGSVPVPLFISSTEPSTTGTADILVLAALPAMTVVLIVIIGAAVFRRQR